MNGPSLQILTSAAMMHGELKRMFLAAGILALFACICWGVQEWGVRKSAVALGWLGIVCLCFAGTCAVFAIITGVLM
jgi:hypothetical protein